MDKSPIKQSANILVANAKAKLAKLEKSAKPPTTELKIETKRELTAGEIAMAKLIFKDSIDYSKVKIVRGGLAGIPSFTENAMTPAGYIHLPNKEYVNIKDFSKADSATDKHWFIHEMTHVWQYQIGTPNVWYAINQFCKGGYTSTTYSSDKKGDELKSYATDISGADTHKKFNEFNFEQQGRIIEFWYDACYLQHENPTRAHHQQSIKLLGYAERILRDFLHNPKDKNLLPKS